MLDADLCIVGAGAAGIALACELENAPLRICLLESGGLEFDRATQALSAGESVGAAYFPLEETRYLGFGGSTMVWAGWCRPLDRMDFEARPWVSNSGWPFAKEHLNPFYERAHGLCALGSYDYDPAAWETPGATRLRLGAEDVIHNIFHVSPPTRFGAAFRSRIARASGIRVLLHASAVELQLAESGRAIERVGVRTLAGNGFAVSARAFVLAAGGIENARLLLLSGPPRGGGVGNERGNVGRFFLEHPYLDPGTFHPADPRLSLAYYFPHGPRHAVEGRIGRGAEEADGGGGRNAPVDKRDAGPGARGRVPRARGVFSLGEATLRREGLLNSAVFFRPRYEAHPAFESKGVRSLLEAWEVLKGRGVPPLRLRLLGDAVRDLDEVAVALCRKVLGSRAPARHWRLRAFVESEPNRDSRVTLGEARDPLGRPRAQVDWRLGGNEMRSLGRSLELLDQALRRAGAGRLEITLQQGAASHPSLTGGKHHMGTTRMHRDPPSGVVDEDCRVHAVSNLFVTGSSVFPTPGYANPTLTIVALALRLADRLKRLLRSAPELAPPPAAGSAS